MKPASPILLRTYLGKIMAACGAFFLVVSFALAVLQPPFQSLASLIITLDPAALPVIDATPTGRLARYLWEQVVIPVLIRPDWMLPTMLGLVCVGIAAQLTWNKPK